MHIGGCRYGGESFAHVGAALDGVVRVGGDEVQQVAREDSYAAALARRPMRPVKEAAVACSRPPLPTQEVSAGESDGRKG